MNAETSLLWWIETFSHIPGHWYPWHVEGRMTDSKYPTWNGNGREFSWRVPNLNTAGGRFVFALRVSR